MPEIAEEKSIEKEITLSPECRLIMMRTHLRIGKMVHLRREHGEARLVISLKEEKQKCNV